MNPTLTFDTAIWSPLAFAAAAAMLLFCVGAYVQFKRGELAGGVRAALVILRCVGVLMVVMLLLRPAWLVEQTLKEKLGLVLLVDASKSMSVRDGMGGGTRGDDVRHILETHSSQCRALAEKYDFRAFAFGRGLSELSLKAYRPEEDFTAIGDAFLRSVAQVTVGNVAGIVILTDGANNYGRDPEAVARELGTRDIPVYPVVVGRKDIGKAFRDVKVVSLGLNPVAFARNRVPVTAELNFVYCAGEKVPVSLWVGGKEVERKVVTVRGQQMSTVVEFVFVPETPGPLKVVVQADPLAGELVTTNNAIASYVHVLSGGLKALYIGRPGSEFKFIRRALSESKDITLDAVATLGREVKAKEWRFYDAVIIGDVASSVFSASQLNALERAVSKEGVGFAMMAGTRNFSAGDYGRTAVAKMLPVILSRTQPEEEFDAEYRLVFTPAGEAHFMLRLDRGDEANRAAWKELRPLRGGVRFHETKPGAQVLAIGPKNEPIVVTGQYGKGRTLAFATNTTSRWSLSPKNTEKYHRRFWRQVLLWLGNKENLGRANVWITLNPIRVIRGDSVAIGAHVESSSGDPVPGAKLEGEATGPDGSAMPLVFTFEEDHYVSSFRPGAVGDYDVKVKAFGADGSPLGEDSAKFVCYMPEAELENPAANPDGLGRIASVSGGKLYTVKNVSELFADLLARDSAIEIRRTEPVPLWGTRWVLYIFLLALTVEWIVRKVHRLI